MDAISPLAIGGILFVIFFLLLLLGSPIMVALGMATMTCFIILDIDLSLMIERAFASLTAFPLMALPAFVLAGALMEAAGISRRLVTIAENIIGPIPGGLAISTVLSCVFFGAISGSGPATTAAVGMLMIPAMTKRGYDTSYAAAATATAGGIGIIIPPSIPMVIYGVTGQVSIAKMFMAGFIPGFIIAASLCLVHYFRCRKISTQGMTWNAGNLVRSLVSGFWSILAPLIILGGIYAGLFTPTEAAIVAIVYTIIIGVFVHRELKFRNFMSCLRTTSWLTGRVLVLVFTATAFGYLLTSYRIPVVIADAILSFTNNVYLVWFFVVILLLFLGMFMETLAIIMLVTPVLLPIMVAYGVDPIHFGLVLICCCGIGFSTPPLGENMFIASGISNRSLESISYQALPMVFANLLAISILVVFPGLVMFLPNMMSSAAL
ncbi:TRAP transporter large permease [uncultured Mailhella sp.]|uniref:TRAP transporter large permease n=1 Tax=uncultured Mailhella sp. TaxID=1981031 RepID=UPI0026259023|nr:TRAP transporter large permease [uncultured Mailhella sp.]